MAEYDVDRLHEGKKKVYFKHAYFTRRATLPFIYTRGVVTNLLN